MNRLTCVFTAITVMLCATMTPFASGGKAGPSANGAFQFTLADGLERSVKFNARIHDDGSSTGEMTFIDPGALDDAAFPHAGFFVKAGFDCLTVTENRAVMSGMVTESNVGEFIGHRVLLVVEDDGEGINAATADKLTWGVYEPVNRNWIPSDAEVPGDTGALLDWIATDFERPDDVGIPARRSEVIGCQSFSLSAYAFLDVRHGQGNIQVRP
ncbi:MAG TPA: hypothetical protein VMZ30_13535 [Pyrinomonadaceae bacterium]|nr:hypothetical protein [Pyrinomonadaceae bacterium]